MIADSSYTTATVEPPAGVRPPPAHEGLAQHWLRHGITLHAAEWSIYTNDWKVEGHTKLMTGQELTTLGFLYDCPMVRSI